MMSIDSSAANRMIEKIKKSKELRVQVGVYNEGNVVLEFNVEGLKWDYKGAENKLSNKEIIH